MYPPSHQVQSPPSWPQASVLQSVWHQPSPCMLGVHRDALHHSDCGAGVTANSANACWPAVWDRECSSTDSGVAQKAAITNAEATQHTHTP